MQSKAVWVTWMLALLTGGWGAILEGCSSGPRPLPEVGIGDVRVESLAVLPLPDSRLSPSSREEILTWLGAALHKRYKLEVITGLALGRAVWRGLERDPAEALQQFRDVLASAKKAHRLLQFSKSLGLLRRARELLAVHGARVEQAKLLTDTYFMSGLVLMLREKVDEAEGQFRQLIALDNAFDPPEGMLQPAHREALERARRQLLSGNPTEVKIASEPAGATVIVDGRKAGKAPVAVPLYPGRHFVRLELAGHAPWLMSFPDGVPPTAIQARLYPLLPGDPPEDLLDDMREDEELSSGARAQLASIAKTHQVDAVLLVALDERDGKVRIATRLSVPPADWVGGKGEFNLGAKPKIQRTRIRQLVRVFKELRGGGRKKGQDRAEPAKTDRKKPPEKSGKKRKRRRRDNKRRKPALEEPPG